MLGPKRVILFKRVVAKVVAQVPKLENNLTPPFDLHFFNIKNKHNL
jgi:hypothetical protein